MSTPAIPPNTDPAAEVTALRDLVASQQAVIAQLQEQVRELTARLQQNSTNSSRPPSADPPGTARRSKPPTGRKRGGQPGHPGQRRELLPAEQVLIQDYFPTHCSRCDAALPAEAAEPAEPWRHQVWEVVPVPPQVTEYRCHVRTCPQCGKRTRAALPRGVPTRTTGPRLQAIAALLSGACRNSRRTVRVLLRELCGVSLSLGTLSALEADTAAALQPSYAEVAQALAKAPARHVDETGWREGGKRYWLWTATTSQLAYFRLDPTRSQAACDALLTGSEPAADAEIEGLVGSDRYSAYAHLPLSQRALCWAHLARDFRGLAESGGASAPVGRWALDVIRELFQAWHRFRRSELDRAGLQAAVEPLQTKFRTLLRWGEDTGCRKGQTLCRALLKQWEALWTWVREEGIEPTNNAAERSLRSGVLWRKSSFGHQSEHGKAFVERMLTTVTTLRLQGRETLAYLEAACRAALHGTPSPSLLPSATP